MAWRSCGSTAWRRSSPPAPLRRARPPAAASSRTSARSSTSRARRCWWPKSIRSSDSRVQQPGGTSHADRGRTQGAGVHPGGCERQVRLARRLQGQGRRRPQALEEGARRGQAPRAGVGRSQRRRHMTDWGSIERRLRERLGLTRRPVAVAFRDAPPAGAKPFTGSEPSGCSFWRLAMEGPAFYTRPADPYNRPVGSPTHNIPLPPERAGELPQVLEIMTGLGYLKMEELPAIPRLPKTPGAIVYAPLGDTPVEPDVVLFIGPPGRLMLLQEAALRAGVAARLPFLGRPTCMALPAALAGGAVASTGCIGNPVYTGAGDDELYVAVAGRALARAAGRAGASAKAHPARGQHHPGRPA